MIQSITRMLWISSFENTLIVWCPHLRHYSISPGRIASVRQLGQPAEFTLALLSTPDEATALHILVAPPAFTLDAKKRVCHLLSQLDSEKTHIGLPCYCVRIWAMQSFSTPRGNRMPPAGDSSWPMWHPPGAPTSVQLSGQRLHCLPLLQAGSVVSQMVLGSPPRVTDWVRESPGRWRALQCLLKTSPTKTSGKRTKNMYKSHILVYLPVPPFPNTHPRENSRVRTGNASFTPIPKREQLSRLEIKHRTPSAPLNL